MSWILPDEGLDRLAMFYDVYVTRPGVRTAIIYLASPGPESINFAVV